MNIERTLVERIGDVGRKLHTARSRNDQVSTDLRLWVRDRATPSDKPAQLAACVRRPTEQDADVVLPGYTHLQRAQPVLAAHYWLAYCEKFERGPRAAGRLPTARQLPLRTAALAGTTIPIDRDMVAEQLGVRRRFGQQPRRLERSRFRARVRFLPVTVAVHLSGWAEEWILWSTTEFGFLKLPHAFSTGSSIMPQKSNPDVLELIRGKCARVIGASPASGAVQGLAAGLQPRFAGGQERLFDSLDTVTACLELAPSIVGGARLNREPICSAGRGYSTPRR